MDAKIPAVPILLPSRHREFRWMTGFPSLCRVRSRGRGCRNSLRFPPLRSAQTISRQLPVLYRSLFSFFWIENFCSEIIGGLKFSIPIRQISHIICTKMNSRLFSPYFLITPVFSPRKMRPFLVFPCVAMIIAMLPGVAWAEVKLPAIISDHMVLKKGLGIRIWGKEDPGVTVTVTLGDNSTKTVAGPDGRWSALLDLSAAKAGPFDLTVEGKNKVVVHDVLVGEVWLASGQSNMAFFLEKQTGSAEEIASPANPALRQFQVTRAEPPQPAEDGQGTWTVASPETSGKFSAVGYFFQKQLNKELGIPVGIISTGIGGSACEAWISPQSIETDPHLKQAREASIQARLTATKAIFRSRTEPSCLFNGMIHPLVSYTINGVIWYQGETNVPRAWQYRSAFPMLIKDWRTQWNQPDLPFYFCQLANFKPKLATPDESADAELRESQSLALNLPNTGQAVLIDIGEAGDIHPKNKKDVGDRLARIALANCHGKKIPFSGPVYQSMKIEGGKIRLMFAHTDGGLVAKPLPATYDVKTDAGVTAPLVRNSPKSALEGFAICGADHKWVWADAKIDGGSVVVWSDQVPQPVAVRYAWASNPTCNLYNGAGLPASPFRTDDERLTTRDVIF
ncbi:MAG: sialate O-acetylesterase [Verrucomicrobiaceae bacterium]|nr:MAG: sialate O-acetylesterase [Verrucomicrobiaceae bacterium]